MASNKVWDAFPDYDTVDKHVGSHIDRRGWRREGRLDSNHIHYLFDHYELFVGLEKEVAMHMTVLDFHMHIARIFAFDHPHKEQVKFCQRVLNHLQTIEEDVPNYPVHGKFYIAIMLGHLEMLHEMKGLDWFQEDILSTMKCYLEINIVNANRSLVRKLLHEGVDLYKCFREMKKEAETDEDGVSQPTVVSVAD